MSGLSKIKVSPLTESILKNRIKYLLYEKNIYPDDYLLATELQYLYPEYKRKKISTLRNKSRKFLDEIEQDDLVNLLDNIKNEKKNESFYEENKQSNIINNSISKIYKEINQEKRIVFKDESIDSKRIKKSSTTNSKENKIDKLLNKQFKMENNYLVKLKSTFSDFAGIDNEISELKQYVSHFLVKENVFSKIKALLIHGPSGVGKSSLVEATANYLNVNLLSTVLYCSINTEKILNEIFEFAKKMHPCIIFLDKIDSIGLKNDNGYFEKDRAIITYLQKLFDSLSDFDQFRIFIIGSATRFEKLDRDILNLFDNYLKIDLPNQKARRSILEIICNSNPKISKSEIDINNLSKITPGFVAKDYYKLFSNANNIAIFEENINSKNFEIEKFDYKHVIMALKKINPISKTEGFAEITNVSWEDIGALKEAKELLEFCIIDRVKLNNLAKDLNLENPEGILMYGPPGCGKTLLAKAIANEAEINFISVKGPELMNKYVGESERAIRELFLRANRLKPCIIFFDEFDSISSCQSETSDISTRILKQLLVEMDGYNPRTCFMLAATNRPDLIDPAILRPGRFDCSIYIGFPNAEERVDILKTITKNGNFPKCSSNIDFEVIGSSEMTEGYTGADLARLVKVASGMAFKEIAKKIKNGSRNNLDPVVTKKHFYIALKKTKPTLGENQRKKFEKMKDKMNSLSK